MAVEAGGGLVEHQDARVFQRGTGDGDALLLATRQLQAALTHQGVIAVGQGSDEIMNIGRAGRGDDFGRFGIGPGIGDVVVEAFVEQHRILGHDADGGAQAFLAYLADVLAVDEDAALVHVIEAEQQARQGGFSGTARAHHRHLLSGGDGEADLVQDGAVGVVGEAHLVEYHLATAHHQVRRVHMVLDLGLFLQYVEHQPHVGEGVLELAIDHAEEVQGNEQLQQEGVDEYQVADTQLAFDHALGGQNHHQGNGDGDDARLAEIQRRQRGLALDRGILPAAQVVVVALQFMGFVAEILHRLVVDQAVDGAGVGLRVQAVHGHPVVHAPFGDVEGEQDIDDHGAEGDGGEPGAVAAQQDGGDQGHFHQGGQDTEHHIVEQRADAAGAALQVAGDATGLAFQMKA